MIKKLKIAPKLILCFLLVALIASTSGIIGIVMLLQTDQEYSNALVTNGFSQGQIGQFNTYLNKGGAIVRDIVMLTEQAEIEAAQAEMQDIIKNTDEALAALRPNCQTPEEQDILAVLDKALGNYRVYRDQVIELGLKNQNEEALNIFRTQARPYLNEAMQAAQQLADLNVTIGNQVSVDMTKGTQVSMLVMVGGLVAAFIASAVVAVVVSRSIAKPIIAVQQAATQLEQGDLQIHVQSDAHDETGIMTRSFTSAAAQIRAYIADIEWGLGEIAKGNFDITPHENFKGDFKAIAESIQTIILSMSNTMGQITQAADQVSSGSDQVSVGAQALSQGATEQASSVEELAATITEVSEQVKITATNAREANEKSDEAGAQVESCNEQMRQMNDAMREISETSGEIGKIIKAIEDIAFQTNILALNAAVEAARAGEAGKGFAVVADEVRNLASKSAEAAKNTTSLIEGSIQAVEKGTKLAMNTAQSLDKVVEGTRAVSTTIQKISQATSEQAMALTQVTTGVDQISSVVQTNSATAEESAAASEELSGQAQILKDLMAQFKLLSK